MASTINVVDALSSTWRFMIIFIWHLKIDVRLLQAVDLNITFLHKNLIQCALYVVAYEK